MELSLILVISIVGVGLGYFLKECATHLLFLRKDMVAVRLLLEEVRTALLTR